MQIMQPLLSNISNSSYAGLNIGKSQHQNNYPIKKLPECYLVTSFRYGRFSYKPFAYLSPQLKKKEYDNGSHQNNTETWLSCFTS